MTMRKIIGSIEPWGISTLMWNNLLWGLASVILMGGKNDFLWCLKKKKKYHFILEALNFINYFLSQLIDSSSFSRAAASCTLSIWLTVKTEVNNCIIGINIELGINNIRRVIDEDEKQCQFKCRALGTSILMWKYLEMQPFNIDFITQFVLLIHYPRPRLKESHKYIHSLCLNMYSAYILFKYFPE